MIAGADRGHLEGADLQPVEILLRRRDRLAIVDLDREVAAALFLDMAGERLDAGGIGARRAPHGEVPLDLLGGLDAAGGDGRGKSEEHTSELQSLMRISYAVFCLKNKK